MTRSITGMPRLGAILVAAMTMVAALGACVPYSDQPGYYNDHSGGYDGRYQSRYDGQQRYHPGGYYQPGYYQRPSAYYQSGYSGYRPNNYMQ